jgi:endogenous inhibitor of DNA gyrase (YacG/DUF329 family)
MTPEGGEEGAVRCPVCRKEAAWRDNPYKPFCSERCRLVDLGKWASGEYRVPGDRRPPEGNDQKK